VWRVLPGGLCSVIKGASDFLLDVATEELQLWLAYVAVVLEWQGRCLVL
jgi:hypothetical protein